MRISVTELDAYRLYRDEDWFTTEMLVDRLSGKDEESANMRAGSAFHKVLELSQYGDDLHACVQDGIEFTFDLDADVSLPKIREVKTEKTFFINGQSVTLSGMADAVEGRIVYDHKLTGQFDAEKYTEAYQWRAYLWLFDANEFRYNIFVAKDDSDTDWTVKEFHRFSCYRYDGMEADVFGQLSSLVEFIRQYVPSRLVEPEGKKLPF